MNTPTTSVTRTPADSRRRRHPRREASSSPDRPRNSRRRWLVGVAAAVAAAAAFGGAVGVGVFDSSTGDRQVLALSTGDVDPSMMMCLELTADTLAQTPVAFRATVDHIDGDTVTMTVDHWYTSGDADAVTVTAPAGMEALIGGLAFEAGQQYLVGAYDDVVAYCGVTGPATVELQALYDQAFAS